jgi:hypothetical protein
VFAEKCKEFPGTVPDVETSSIEFQMGLGCDRFGFGLTYDRRKSDLIRNTLQRKAAAQVVIRRAGGSGWDRLSSSQLKFGYRLFRDVEEIVTRKMVNQHLIDFRIFNVIAGERFHIDLEVGVLELTLA